MNDFETDPRPAPAPTGQLPTLPGCIDGVVGLDPLRLQCRDCGAIADHTSVGMNRDNPRADGVVITTSGFHFHLGGWPDGTNPRLCRACRVARGCDCPNCQRERACRNPGITSARR